MVYKCKICGGTLNIDETKSVCTCDYCGSVQTFPKINSDNVNRLISRAESYRRDNQYDNAIKLYNQVLDEEKEDPEIYWLIVLCQYGVEYVDDIKTHKKVATINRTSRSSIFSNENYKKAIELADYYQREEYQKEAALIDNIQKQILELSSEEEPYDVFISYKETDKDGNRTEDSTIAYDIYQRLTKNGYRVFYSKVSLNDKVGNTYEPIIFSALNTSKVMILVGTSLDNILSPWVRNEWSRYVSLMKSDSTKHLIPVYKDVNPGNFPDEIAYYQGLSVSDLGWEQDLDIALSKFINKEKTSKESNQGNIERLFDRAELYLRNNDFDEAYRQFDRVIDYDLKNSNAYIGKLLSEFKVHNLDELKNYVGLISNSKNYNWLINNSSDDIKESLIKIASITSANLQTQKTKKNSKIIKIALSAVILLILATIGIRLLKKQFQHSSILSSNVGDIVTLGSYEQDGNSINGKENIEWIVLHKDNDSSVLISRYVLDCQSYSTTNTYVQYEDSFIKQWLNNDFYNDAFDNQDKKNIISIRLLTTDEAKDYFNDVSQRTCVASKFSISKGLQVSSTYGNCEYWLIPSNNLSHYAAKVNANGSINAKADGVNVGNGVRPLIIVKR